MNITKSFVCALLGGALLAPLPLMSASNPALNKEVLRQQKKLSALEHDHKDIVSEIQDYEKQILMLDQHLVNIDQQYTEALQVVENRKKAIKELEALSPRTQEQLIQRLTAYYTTSDIDILSILFSAQSVDDLLSFESANEFAINYDENLFKEHQDTIDELQYQRALSASASRVMQSTKDELVINEEKLRELVETKSRFAQRLLTEADLYRDSILRLQRSAAQIPEGKKQNPSKRILKSTTFQSLKGKLVPPAESSILTHFKEPVTRYGNSSAIDGVEIQTTPNETIHAVYNGLVTHAGFSEGYGNLVIIDHGQKYYTLYSGLSTLSIRSGDVVKASDTLGKMPTRLDLESDPFYFEIRHQDTSLNPEEWCQFN